MKDDHVAQVIEAEGAGIENVKMPQATQGGGAVAIRGDAQRICSTSCWTYLLHMATTNHIVPHGPHLLDGTCPPVSYLNHWYSAHTCAHIVPHGPRLLDGTCLPVSYMNHRYSAHTCADRICNGSSTSVDDHSCNTVLALLQ